MTTYIVSDHQIAEPKANGKVITISDFNDLFPNAFEYSSSLFSENNVYIDVNVIDSDEFIAFQEAAAPVTFFYDTGIKPTFWVDSIQDWTPKSVYRKEKLARANNIFHKLILDRSLKFFILPLIGSFVLQFLSAAMLQGGRRASLVDVIIMFAAVLLLLYSMIGFTIVILRKGATTSKDVAEKVGRRCLSCKKWGSLKKTRLEVLSTKSISVKRELSTRSKYDGKVVSTSEQYIPGTRTYIRQWYKCKNCGNDCYFDSSQDTANL